MGDSTTLAELHDKYDEMARCTDEVAFGIRHLRRLICRSDALTPGAGPVAATWPPPDPLVVASIPLEGYWRLYDPKVFGPDWRVSDSDREQVRTDDTASADKRLERLS